MFTKDEKEYLKKLVSKNIEEFKAEESNVTMEMSPAFIKGESEYEEFLQSLIKKLGE